MGKSSKSFGLVPRSNTVGPASPHIIMRAHGQGSAAGKVGIVSNITGAPAELDIAGTTTNLWDAPGYLSPSASDDNSIQLAAAWARPFMRLDTLENVGGLLILMNLQGTALTGNQNIIEWSAFDDAQGGIQLRYLHAQTSIDLRMRTVGSGGLTQIAAFDSFGNGENHAIAMYLDCVNRVCRGRRSENGAAPAVATTEAAFPAGTLPTFQPVWGLAFFALSGATIVTRNTEVLRIADVYIVRIERDFSAEFAALGDEYAKFPREAPRLLAGV